MSILAFDFGGTRTRAGWYQQPGSDGLPHLIQRDETLTRADEGPDAVIARLIALGRGVIPPGAAPRVIGISAPGPHHAASGLIYHSYALPGWRDVPLGAILSTTFGAPVYMENDGNTGAIAEYAGGAGQGANPMIYMTVSTGIGGGVILDGRLFTGWSGLAAEPGHVLVQDEDGQFVRLEAVASGTALGARARRRLERDDRPSALRQAERVDGAAVGRAALDGDALALALIEETGVYLGVGLVNLLHLFSPEAVVIGGSVAKLGELLFAPARRTVERLVLSPRFVPPRLIRPAAYGEDVCLIGAALWAARNFNG